MEILHKSNILIHVVAGTIALVLGAIAIIVNKGKKLHKQVGNIFTVLLFIVILTLVKVALNYLIISYLNC